MNSLVQLKQRVEGLRVLAIDDEQDNLGVYRELLGLFGIDVCLESSGDDALVALDSLIPDVIVVDLQMPDMDGWKLLTNLKSRALLKGVPVIAVTAHAMVGDAERVLEAGFDYYLAKPIVDAVGFVRLLADVGHRTDCLGTSAVGV